MTMFNGNQIIDVSRKAQEEAFTLLQKISSKLYISKKNITITKT